MIDIQKNISLSPYTSWLVGGVADYFALPKTLDEVIESQKWAFENKVPITILGGGSNVLVSDRGVRGLVICFRKFAGSKTEEKDGRLHIEALAGSGKSELLKIFLKNKLAPALFLAGLPGDVGGGIVMNAGVAEMFQPREFVEITDWIEVLRDNGQVDRLLKNDLKWSYRHTDGWQPGIVVKAGFSWAMQKDETILDQVKAANKMRLSKQPLDMPSCGSVFRNPEGHKAAQLIDSSGLKGFSIGDAQVSMKHANFIVNKGDAKAVEIWQVIEHVKKTVLAQKGVALSTEVIRLGEWTEVQP